MYYINPGNSFQNLVCNLNWIFLALEVVSSIHFFEDGVEKFTSSLKKKRRVLMSAQKIPKTTLKKE